MKTHRLLIAVSLLLIAVFVLSNCSSPTPVPPTPVPPPDTSTPFVVSTPSAPLPSLDLPTLTPTPQPTPLPTKPRPGYTPVPDSVISPVVINRSPLAGETAKPDGTIQLVFDLAMDKAAVESAFQVYPAVTGRLAWQDDKTLVFTPAEKLTRAGIYDVVLDQRARDAQGAPLNQAYQFRFATAGFLEVAQVIPAPSTADAEPGSTITVIFNRPVVPLTNLDAQKDFPQPVSLTANGNPIAGAGEWLNTSIYVYKPAQPLPGGTIITAKVGATLGGRPLVDTDNNPLAADYTWQFAVQPPKVVYLTPGNGSAQVPIESPIVVQFNQPISLDSAREHVSLTSSTGQSVPLVFDVVSETLTVTPTNRLDFEAAYVIKIAAGLTGRSGGSGMRETVNALFTTVPLPKIISTDPTNGQRDVYAYTSFNIRFNTPMNHDTVMDHLTFNPPLSPTQVYTYGYGDSFGINFGAQPSTDYEVKIAPGIQDPYGNETKEALTVRFRTADLEPSVNLHVPNFVGTYNAYDPAQVYAVNTNIKTIEAKLYRLNADQFSQLQNYSYDNNLPLGELMRQWSQSVEAPLNKQQATRLDLVEGGGTLAPGLYLLDVNSPQLKPESYYYNRRHVLVVSRHNVTLKTSQTGALAWVTDYQSGQPVANVPLRFFGYDNQQLGNATTDAQGLAAIAAGNVIGAVSIEPFAAASNEWSGGISQYDFGLSGGYSSGDQYRGYLYTDRPIYRPGQSVKFKGVIRREDDAKFSLLDVGNVRVVINSPNGETVFDQQLPVNSLGTFASEVKLADGAALGNYYVNVESSAFSFGAAFTVAAYRAPEFQVNVTPKDTEIVRGASTSVGVQVSYFFGGGVANRPVQWNVIAQDFNFTPPWGGNYRWSDSDDPWMCFDCWWFSRYTPPPQPILSGSGTTDAQGNLTVELPADLLQDGQPISQSVRLTLEATVTGNDNQVISGRGSIIRHSGDFYVGVQTRAYVGEESKPSTIDLIAVDWQGNRLANKSLQVSVVRREWENKFVANEFGGGDWQYEQKDVPITTSTVTTNERGEATFDYTPPAAGSYKITVKATDNGGREVRASVFQWVTGREFVSWRRENNDRISLIGDKSSYVPGETAKILIPSPFQGEHWALITIERGGILQRQLVKIVSNSQIFELPITSDLAPNVYVSVVLIKGQDATNKLSDYKVGLLPIEVKPIAQTLNVTLTPDKATAQPGENVTYNVQVTDSSGAAIQAEFSLDLVDKAVLSLLPRSPDEMLNAFYGNRGLGVNTATALSVSVNKFNEQLKLDEEQQQAAQRQALASGAAEAPMAMPAPQATMMPGAPAMDAAKSANAYASEAAPLPNVEVRQDFSDTAYWSPQVSTDANGQASVTIKLPDNLTTWTFRGVGLTADTKVGEATIDVVATKPLLIRPVTPRFFVVGDKAQLSANVSNNTENPLSVTLTLSSTGVTLLSEAQQIVQIPAKSEGSATWTVEAQDVPNVQLVFFAQSGDFADASKPRLATGPDGSLLVYRYTAPDIVGTAGQIKDGGSRTEIIALPQNVDVTKGEVSVEIDPSLAAGMIKGLKYLEHYQYECAEQTVSRFLPNVLTYRALKELGVENAELTANLPGLVDEGLNRLYLQQKSDGGWGWWVDSESNPHLTAYVVFGLIQARDAGFAVRADVIERGEQYVLGNLSNKPAELAHWQANQQAWFLFVLSEDSKAPADKLNALFEERGKLSHFAKAYLAMAFGKGNDRVQVLMSDLNNAAILSATGAHWEENNYDWWSMNTDTRSTGIILSAYARLDASNALAPNIVRWLMVARKVGHWETTQETAWALIGLTDWMKVTGELKPNYDYALFLNDTSISEGAITPDKVQQPIELSIAIKDLMIDQANRLTFSRGPGEGVLYYTAHLRVFQPVEALKPVDRGVIVSRRYTLASCKESDRSKCPEVTQAKLGDVIRVDLTLVAPNDLYYLVVEDPLPAGAEAIDRGLATTSMLDQNPTLSSQPRYSDSGEAFYSPWWRWWNWYSRSELRDEKVVLFADYLGRGTYEYSYTMRATLPGDYKVIPTVASEFYFPEVFGRSDGRLLSIGK